MNNPKSIINCYLMLLISTTTVFADDPCGVKARQSPMGQSSSQLLENLNLTQNQEDKIIDIQLGLYSYLMDNIVNIEVKRQKLMDAFLVAAEDDVFNDNEKKEMEHIIQEQKEMNSQLNARFELALKKIQSVLSKKQNRDLTRSKPKLHISDEKLEAGNALLGTVPKIKQEYLQHGFIPSNTLVLLKTVSEDANSIVYVPTWMRARLDAVSIDFQAYTKEFLKGLKRVRSHYNPEFDEPDFFVDLGYRMLSDSFELASNSDNPKFKGVDQKAYNETLILMPVTCCLLQDRQEDRVK